MFLKALVAPQAPAPLPAFSPSFASPSPALAAAAASLRCDPVDAAHQATLS